MGFRRLVTRALIASAVKLISEEYPFWNRSRGSDHVFVASHDFGSCFHTLEDVAIADGVSEIMKNSIVLQTFGVEYDHPCQDVEHVVIPPYVSPEKEHYQAPAQTYTPAQSPYEMADDYLEWFRTESIPLLTDVQIHDDQSNTVPVPQSESDRGTAS